MSPEKAELPYAKKLKLIKFIKFFHNDLQN